MKKLAGFAVVVSMMGVGCGAPLRVQRISPHDSYREQIENVLSSDDLSDDTTTVLRRHDLLESYEKDPGGAVSALLGVIRRGQGGSDEFFALAELSQWRAEADEDRDQYLAAAVYAYAFLFPRDPNARVSFFDPRTRIAADLYSRALTLALKDPETSYFAPASGRRTIPNGTVEIDFDSKSLDWYGYRLVDLVPVGELRVDGMKNRYRQAGVGVPIAARPQPALGKYGDSDLVGPNIRVPVTAVMHIEAPRIQIASGNPIQASLKLYSMLGDEEIKIEDQMVPLESEPTVVLADMLVSSKAWETELSAFLGRTLNIRSSQFLLRGFHPCEPGKIPLVFVHGTASSVFRWADMVNDLQSDTELRKHYQMWFFSYDSGNPIAYSAYQLRRMLKAQIDRCMPPEGDESLSKMVVVGHSQGGLLTKMTAIDSGDRFWTAISNIPFADAKLSPSTRAVVSEGMFVKPLPFVRRLIFIATPHRGSYLAGPEFVRRIAQKLLSFPSDLASMGAELGGLGIHPGRGLSMETIPTSIDNMSPGHPFIRTLSSIPLEKGVHSHSIIPVRQLNEIEDGNDGVVEYRSAHIDEAESELIVHDSHSTQSNPHTIEEVRRILKMHAEH